MASPAANLSQGGLGKEWNNDLVKPLWFLNDYDLISYILKKISINNHFLSKTIIVFAKWSFNYFRN
jgi:hypothetical protein